MPLPPLVILPDEATYEQYFRREYINKSPITTFDGIDVWFFGHNFKHAFYVKSSREPGARKDAFSEERARRMGWIRAVLVNPGAEVYRRKMPHGKINRIALLPIERYAVIIQVEKSMKKANFITAYNVTSDSAYQNMRRNPVW